MMSETGPSYTQRMFEFCYKLYLDPIYRYICFPPDQVAGDRLLSKEQFISAWKSLAATAAADHGGSMQQALARVIRSVRTLNPVEQDVLLLRYGADLPYWKIAERVERSPDACHVIHYRALSQFCERVNQEDPYTHV